MHFFFSEKEKGAKKKAYAHFSCRQEKYQKNRKRRALDRNRAEFSLLAFYGNTLNLRKFIII